MLLRVVFVREENMKIVPGISYREAHSLSANPFAGLPGRIFLPLKLLPFSNRNTIFDWINSLERQHRGNLKGRS